MSLEGYAIKDIDKVIKGIDGKKILKVDVSRLTAPGDNYISLVFRVDILVESKAEGQETIHAVAKRLPLRAGNIDFNARAMANEIRWYSELVPLLNGFAETYGVKTNYYPTYMGSRFSLDSNKTEADSEAVLLTQNLIPQGFINEDRLIGFDLKAARAILKSLAQFHAIPLAAKFNAPDIFKKIKDFLDSSVPWFDEPSAEEGHEVQTDLTPELLILEKALQFPACQPYVKNLEKLKKEFLPINERFKSGVKEPWGTVVHYDFWTNNIMVKYGEEVSVKILDFQVCLYSSYARDVVFFLLTSLNDEVQKHHLDDLLRYYYEELTSALEKFHVPELVLTYEDYLEEVRRVMLLFEGIHVLYFVAVIFAPKDNQPDHLTGETDMFDHIKTVINNMKDRSKEKLALVIELCVKRGWM